MKGTGNFSVPFPKKLSNGTVMYYYSIYDSSRTRRQFSTGARDLSSANRVVLQRMRDGKLIPNDPQAFQVWTGLWYLYDRCPYIGARLARGYGFSATFARSCRSLLTRVLWPAIGQIPLSQIYPYHVEQVLLAERANGSSNDKLNRCLSLMKVVFGEAHRLGVIKSNPAESVRQYHHVPAERGILSSYEFEAMFDLRTSNRVWRGKHIAYCACLVAAVAGLRLGELQGLQQDDVCDEILRVRHGWDRSSGLKGTKTGKERAVPVPPPVVALLRRLSASGHVFSLDGGKRPVSATYISSAFREALRGVGVGDELRKRRRIGTHSLRHGLVSSLLAKGVPVSVVSAVVGHTTSKLTGSVYHHSTPFHLQQIAQNQPIPESLTEGSGGRTQKEA